MPAPTRETLPARAALFERIAEKRAMPKRSDITVVPTAKGLLQDWSKIVLCSRYLVRKGRSNTTSSIGSIKGNKK